MRTAQCSSQSANIATDFQIYEVENDPTYFSEVLRHYQSTVESLLSHSTSETLEAIDQEDLNYFRKTYGDSSYVCRYRQCPRASNGFRSQKDREAHEVLHVKRFKCADTSCEFYTVGFASKNALKTHDQKYHTKQKDKDIPKFRQKASKTLPETRREDLTSWPWDQQSLSANPRLQTDIEVLASKLLDGVFANLSLLMLTRDEMGVIAKT